MKLKNPKAEFFVPDNKAVDEALKRTTHMAIAAHQDDIEIMAAHGMLECFGRDDRWFFGVVVTNGAGSPRNGLYAKYTDEEMQQVRKMEQKKSAFVGEYSGVALLDYPSGPVKDPKNSEVVQELKELIATAQPQVIYTHNLADKHDTHVAVVLRVIAALRLLPKESRPEKVYACEVWRNLDWVTDNEKVLFDVSEHPNIVNAILEVHDSQDLGGKRYDLAAVGRRLANATFFESHETDKATALTFGIDLTPLIDDPKLDLNEYIQGYINRFKDDVTNRLKKML